MFVLMICRPSSNFGHVCLKTRSLPLPFLLCISTSQNKYVCNGRNNVTYTTVKRRYTFLMIGWCFKLLSIKCLVLSRRFLGKLPVLLVLLFSQQPVSHKANFATLITKERSHYYHLLFGVTGRESNHRKQLPLIRGVFKSS